MRIESFSQWFVPFALMFASGCSSDGAADAGSPEGGAGDGGAMATGGATAGGSGGAAGSSTGGAATGGASKGGASGSGGASKGGATGTGGKSTGGSAGAGGAGKGGASGAGGAAGAAGGGAGGTPLTFQCADPAPNVTAPPAAWANSTGNLAGMASECGNLGLVSANRCSNMVIAGVAKAGLWGTEDGGKSWSKLGTGAGSATITNRISAVVYDPDHPGTFWESGIYNGGGVYKTTDNGKSFAQVGDVTHNDSVSIDFSEPDRKTMLAGPHEAPSKLFRSTDSGKTWSDVGTSLPGSAGFCTATQVLNPTNLLVGCTDGGVFRSTNGTTWTSVGSKGVSAQPLWARDGIIYWLGTQGGVNVSTDQGQHFTQTVDASVAPAIVGPAYPAELPDGRIVVIGRDHLQISSDKGVTWKPIGQPLPYPGGGYDGARGPTYSARTKTFYIWRWDCGDNVPTNAVMSAGFDYMKE
jgi:hypothetical protein